MIELQQIAEPNKEIYLRILVPEIKESIAAKLKRDLEAERIGNGNGLISRKPYQISIPIFGNSAATIKIYL